MKSPIHRHSLTHNPSSKLSTIYVLHGPNLNLLGTREPEIYGSLTLENINKDLYEQGKNRGFVIECFQENSEGAFIDHIHVAKQKQVLGLLINAAGYSHTSIVIRDALLAVALPTVEVHLSNIYRRESFRHTSLLAPVCIGCVIGFGAASYTLGLDGLIDHLFHQEKSFL